MLLIQAFLVYFVVHLINFSFDAGSVVSNFFAWLLSSAFIFFVAYIFKLEGKDYLRLIYLLAFASLPYLFMGPINVYAEFSAILAGLLGLGIKLWTFILSTIAIATICEISQKKAVLLLSLPFVMLLLGAVSLIFRLLV